ncbi:MAG: hypothetical protein V2J51_09185 [Erythrobacter sp.]|jgi:hypothetical protein|nr:hypothetical protein [Erythrobacter sp.]
MASHDLKDARSTYDRFMSAVRWAVPAIALIVLFVMILIAD